MNISPIGQNQGTQKSPNFKGTLVATIGKSVKGYSPETLLPTVNFALTGRSLESGDKLIASTRKKLYVWLDSKFDPQLEDVAKALNNSFAQADATFEVVKGMPKAVKKHLAELASKGQ